MSAICNLNGEVLAEERATIPVLDRGFLFGDSVYEVMRTRGGVPFAWPEHLERLRRSAGGIRLELDLDDGAVLRRIRACLDVADHGESYVRVIVTRGVGTAPSIDLAYAPGPPNWVILVRPYVAPVEPAARLAIVPRLRTDRRALDPGIKSGNYLNNLLGLAEAKERGATDCLFLNQEGHVTEASTSNVYLVKSGVVLTPPLRAGLLPGITRQLLFDYAKEAGIELREADLTEQDVQEADEVFLSSTLKDVYPVVEVDGRPIGDGRPGPLTRRLAAGFEEYCERLARHTYAPAFASLTRDE